MITSLGQKGEQYACSYLRKKGYRILRTNYRVRGSEIDIIAQIPGIFVFVEVKSRSNTSFGSAKESITAQKIDRMLRGIGHFFLRELGLDEIPEFRIDLIALQKSQEKFTLEHIQNISTEDL